MATNMSEQVETFKKILEYFVKHMAFRCECIGESLTPPCKISFTDDEKQRVKKQTGQGYNGDEIQSQMERIADVYQKNVFSLGDNFNSQKICISVYPTESGLKKGSYLHLVSCSEEATKARIHDALH